MNAALQYSESSTPLTKPYLLSLTNHNVALLPTLRLSEISFSDSGFTLSWLRGFLSKYLEQKVKHARTIDERRVNALTIDHGCEHIARVEEAVK